MKKIIAIALIASFVCAAVAPSAFAVKEREPGGFVAGLVGCCFGIRTVADWNEGKNINIREWLQLVWVGYVWAALEGYSGVTTSDLQKSDPGYF